MKRVCDDWIMQGLYVDDMIHASTSEALKQQFIKEYTRDFEITLEETMTLFLGLKIEQGPQGIDLHLDTYIQEAIDEYGTYFKKPLKPKKVPMQPGVVLSAKEAIVQNCQIRENKRSTDPSWPSCSLHPRGCDVIPRSPPHNSRDIVRLQVLRIGQLCVISWATW